MTSADLQELLRQAQESHQSGRLEEAERSYLRLVESAPVNPDLWHLLGVIAYQQGAAGKAITHFRKALDLRADFPQAHNNLALALKAAGDLAGAEAAFTAALEARPDYAEAAYNLALLHEAAGANARAEQAYRQALAHRADWVELLGNLGNLLRRMHRAAEAEPLLQRALALRPEDATALGNLALLRIEQGRFSEALALAQAAIARAPGVALWWEAAGSAARLAQDPDTAMPLLERSTALAPGEPGAWFELGLAREACGDDASAAEALAKARALAPRWERLRWAEALLLPALVRDEAAAAQALQRFDRGLERLATELALDTPESRDAALEAASSVLPFHLHYLPGDHTQRQSRFADLVSRSVRAGLPSLASPPAHRPPAMRLRVGFVSSYLRQHVVARFFAAFVTGLPRAQFERWVWLTSGAADSWSGEIAAAVEHFETVDDSLPRIAQRIRDADLDVLVYPDIGLDPQQHALAALRLAPVQAALYGHPVTSGLDSIDFFVSGELLEDAQSQAQYRETLVRLPGLGAKPRAPAAPGDGRWAQALRAGKRPLVVCAQNLSKIPPAFDATLAEVLSRSAARVIFIDRGASLTRRFLDRLRARNIDASAIHVEAARPYADFLAGLAAADLILDTPGFSGGGTSLDALGLGVPVLAFEGDSARSRQTSAMLRLIEVPELIAADSADYARRALELLADGGQRSALRKRIAERSHLLFDDPRPLAGFAAFLQDSVRHSAR
jgi:protein O-GlcNAc transferase